MVLTVNLCSLLQYSSLERDQQLKTGSKPLRTLSRDRISTVLSDDLNVSAFTVSTPCWNKGFAATCKTTEENGKNNFLNFSTISSTIIY